VTFLIFHNPAFDDSGCSCIALELEEQRRPSHKLDMCMFIGQSHSETVGSKLRVTESLLSKHLRWHAKIGRQVGWCLHRFELPGRQLPRAAAERAVQRAAGRFNRRKRSAANGSERGLKEKHPAVAGHRHIRAPHAQAIADDGIVL